ncbi:P2X purinoceptor 4, partial [Brachionus plicatilis]
MGLASKKSKLYIVKKFFSSIFFGYFSYTTVREAKIHNFLIAFIFRILQLLIFIYIIGWDIIKNKSYQATDSVSSTVTSKVKGLGYVKYPDRLRTLDPEFLHRSQFNYRIFDTADYIVPPNEYNSVFLMTNFVETIQTQSLCSEDFTKTYF